MTESDNLTKDEFIESFWQELFDTGINRLPDNNKAYVEFKDMNGNAVKAINNKFRVGHVCSGTDINDTKKKLIKELFVLIKSDLLNYKHNCLSIRSPVNLYSFNSCEENSKLIHKATVRYLSCKDADEKDFKANCWNKGPQSH